MRTPKSSPQVTRVESAVGRAEVPESTIRLSKVVGNVESIVTLRGGVVTGHELVLGPNARDRALVLLENGLAECISKGTTKAEDLVAVLESVLRGRSVTTEVLAQVRRYVLSLQSDPPGRGRPRRGMDRATREQRFVALADALGLARSDSSSETLRRKQRGAKQRMSRT